MVFWGYVVVTSWMVQKICRRSAACRDSGTTNELKNSPRIAPASELLEGIIFSTRGTFHQKRPEPFWRSIYIPTFLRHRTSTDMPFHDQVLNDGNRVWELIIHILTCYWYGILKISLDPCHCLWNLYRELQRQRYPWIHRTGFEHRFPSYWHRSMWFEFLISEV